MSLAKFADGVEPHAAFRAGQVFPLSEGHQGILHGDEGRDSETVNVGVQDHADRKATSPAGP